MNEKANNRGAAGNPGPAGAQAMPAGNAPTAQTGQADANVLIDANARRPSSRRRRLTLWSAAVFILLPTLLAAVYFTFIAADQYAAEVKFSIRGAEKSGSADLLGIVSGLPSATSTVTDSYIIMEYIHSRELVDKLQERIDLRKVYSTDKADWFMRFNPKETIEEFVEYWKWMANVEFDSSTNIIAVEVRAFSAEEAQMVAQEVLKLSEGLVNDLSERVRSDAVRFAEQEVLRAEGRLRSIRLEVRKFRDLRQEIDPVKKAESRLTILGTMNQELVGKKAELTTLQRYLNKSAPTVRLLENEIASLEKQIELERSELGEKLGKDGGRIKLSSLLADYEELIVDREFASKAYVSALSSLELARAEADRQQRYLAAFVRPSLPQEAIYPERIINIILVLVVSSVLWALGLLVVYGIRDHG